MHFTGTFRRFSGESGRPVLVSFGLVFIALLVFFGRLTAQSLTPSVNFHHITVRDGLNDALVNGICQDKYGYMWFASLGALNRFNGRTIKRFTHMNGDSTSAPGAIPYAMVCDVKGRLWIGNNFGLYEFDYLSGTFRKHRLLGDRYVFSLCSSENGELYLGTKEGLLIYDPDKNNLLTPTGQADPETREVLTAHPVVSLHHRKGTLYIGSESGVVRYDCKERTAKFTAIPGLGGRVNQFAVDPEGYWWLASSAHYKLLRMKPGATEIVSFDHILRQGGMDGQPASVTGLEADAQGQLWIATNLKGLVQYDIRKQKAIFHKPDHRLPNSISSNLLRGIYQGKDGSIWLAGAAGVDYLYPQKNLFSVVFPLPGDRDQSYARGIAEDERGNLWMATADGISSFDPTDKTYRTWRNTTGKPDVIYYNSVRGIADDAQGNIWVATGKGVNRYKPETGKMDFMTEKDSLPASFYFCAVTLPNGQVWFGTRDFDGFYFYNPPEGRAHSIASVPALQRFKGKGGRYVLEDSRGRLWLGFNEEGLGMYDPLQDKTSYWFNEDTQSENTIIGNQIVDIKEDKKGVIWVSTFSGITGIDTDHNRFISFHDRNGLPSNHTGPLAVDPLDRLWIGTANGLMMLDAARKNFTRFDETDGLPTVDFTEHPGQLTHSGKIVMPTSNGYIVFDPLRFRPQKTAANFFVSEVRTPDKPFAANVNYNALEKIRLKANQNFFNIQLEALDFAGAEKQWYAYKLDGLDEEWRISQNPEASYTDVPGGEYTFRYKASTNPNDWSLPEKRLRIHIESIFYQTIWFWLVMVALAGLLIYLFVKDRMRYEKMVFTLTNKTQLLEKEKTSVMYENLKQQLNPHFLFNSLTSLGSLIRINPGQAGEFLDSLSQTYRYILRSSDHDTVALSQEIDFAKAYVKLQQTRFEEGLEVHFQIDEVHFHRKIVPVTLQNLIENAIKHNITDEDSPLVIRVSVEADYLVVQNNLQIKNYVETSNGKGIARLKSLYEFLASRPIIAGAVGNYFTVKIPLL